MEGEEKNKDIPVENKEDNEGWDDVGSDQERVQEEAPKDKKVEKVVPKEPKKPLHRDKHGEIVIDKLDAYVDPVKTVKEAKADVRDINRYNFKDLNIGVKQEEDEPVQEPNENNIQEVVEEDEVKHKKKKKGPTKKMSRTRNTTNSYF